MQAAAVIVAAGRGSRVGGAVPKQFQLLAGRPVLELTMGVLAAVPEIAQLVIVLHAEDEAHWASLKKPAGIAIAKVEGGDSRSASVRAGLAAIADDCPLVLIHDAARPCVPPGLIGRVLDALTSMDAAAPALAVTDALWRGQDGRVIGAADRSGLFRAQTPQGFRTEKIRLAHAAHADAAADDVEVARAHGLDVAIVDGDEENIKITLPGDLARAEAILRRREERAMDIRTGNGFDVHRFAPGESVTLCGVTLPHDRALDGHSDADVGMHALTDAIYGAVACGDIGQHFPPSDPQWRGADSAQFLTHAVRTARARGYRVGNADCTLICERPKIGPHAPAMRTALAALMRVGSDAVSVKATTAERMGFVGREEGIAALASVTLIPL